MNRRLLLVGIGLLPCSYPLPAAILCVTNGTELTAALQTAATNNEADTIRLAVGNYRHPGGGTFTYMPGAGPGRNLQISGGWSHTSAGGACGQQSSGHHALHTVITSTAGNVRLMDIAAPANSDMYVRILRLSFVGGGGTGQGNGLRINGGGAAGGYTIENCAFVANQGGLGAALLIVNQGRTWVRNSLFESNGAIGGGGVAAYITAWEGGTAYFTNNTVVNNHTDGISFPRSGLEMWIENGQAVVANNHLWSNEGDDLMLRATENAVIVYRNNNRESARLVVDTTGNIIATDNLSLETEYVSNPVLSFIPAPGSPLIDAGTVPPPPPRPWEDNWPVGTIDLLNHERIQGSSVDIGAYEAPWVDLIFADGFE